MGPDIRTPVAVCYNGQAALINGVNEVLVNLETPHILWGFEKNVRLCDKDYGLREETV
jgi:hypothetical protein